jgi:hypothetical protein
VNDRKLFLVSGLLRNSTIFAAQKLGFEQCSQKAPETAGKLKRRPDCSGTPHGSSALRFSRNSDLADSKVFSSIKGGSDRGFRINQVMLIVL